MSMSIKSGTVGNFAWRWLRRSDIAAVHHRNRKNSKRRKHASSHLVYHHRFHCGLRRQGAPAYASVDHVDNRAWYRWINYRRRGNPSIFPAKCRRPLPSRGTNRFHSWSDCSFVRLAQVQAATTSRVVRITLSRPPEAISFKNGRARPPGAPTSVRGRLGDPSLPRRQIDLDRFDSRLESRSLAPPES